MKFEPRTDKEMADECAEILRGMLPLRSKDGSPLVCDVSGEGMWAIPADRTRRYATKRFPMSDQTLHLMRDERRQLLAENMKGMAGDIGDEVAAVIFAQEVPKPECAAGHTS